MEARSRRPNATAQRQIPFEVRDGMHLRVTDHCAASLRLATTTGAKDTKSTAKTCIDSRSSALHIWGWPPPRPRESDDSQLRPAVADGFVLMPSTWAAQSSGEAGAAQ